MCPPDDSETSYRDKLTPLQYSVAREGGTERAFTGKLYKQDGTGMYRCVCCDAELFASSAKFDSGCGWPSFSSSLPGDGVKTLVDRSHGMERTEIQCAKCDAHLGHVFEDGPTPTGLRYCVNSASLAFEDEDGNRTDG